MQKEYNSSMSNQIASAYDDFSSEYDRFVNWTNRLRFELPFLTSKLAQAPQAVGRLPRVLDAACGTGQHALALAGLGYAAAGADLSAGMIQRARENAQARDQNVPFAVAGFGALAAEFGEASFDALLCLGNSLPHVLDEAGLAMALGDFAQVLRPGGVLILQQRNFDAVLAQGTSGRWMGPEAARDGETEWLFVRFYDFRPDHLIDFNILRLKREGDGAWQQALTQTRLRPLVQDDLDAALTVAGFERVEWYGGLDGSPFDPAVSGNLVVVAYSGDRLSTDFGNGLNGLS